MKTSNKLVLKGTTSYFEQTSKKTAQKMADGDLVFLNMPLPVRCNYACPKCFSGGSDIYQRQLEERGNSTEFKSDLRKRLITEANEAGAETLVIAGAGEPLMSPELDDTLDAATKMGMSAIVFTNGSLLSKERAEKYFSKAISIVFSFDSVSPEHYDRLTGTKGNYKLARRNIETALDLSEKYAYVINSHNVVPLAVNTNVTLLTYDPPRGIDEIKAIKELIDGRATHFVSHITPTGDARENWDWLVGTEDFSPNCMLKEAEKYSNGLGGSSRRKNGKCAYIHNGITVYEGHYMMCPNMGLMTDLGKYPDISVSEHFAAKRKLLQEQGNPLCATRR